MSLKEVDQAMLELQIDDEMIQTPGNCRYAAKTMMNTAVRADKTPPLIAKEIVVWRPENTLNPDTNVHFAVKIGSGTDFMIFNPSPTALFPRYNGPLDRAPGLLKEMKPTDELGKIKKGQSVLPS